MRMKILFILIITSIVGTNILQAQFGRIYKPPKQYRIKSGIKFKQKKTDKNILKDLIKDLEEWTDDNVLPGLRDWKDKFDSYLLPEDLEKLNSYRKNLSDVKKELKDLQDKKKIERRHKKSNGIQEENSKVKELKLEEKDMTQLAKPFVKKYRNVLDSIFFEAKPKIVKWEQEASDLIVKLVEKNNYNLTDKEKKKMEEYWRFGKKITMNKFIIWDGKTRF
jgi:hypothetical protein